jgi:hypothetical protein
MVEPIILIGGGVALAALLGGKKKTSKEVLADKTPEAIAVKASDVAEAVAKQAQQELDPEKRAAAEELAAKAREAALQLTKDAQEGKLGTSCYLMPNPVTERLKKLPGYFSRGGGIFEEIQNSQVGMWVNRINEYKSKGFTVHFVPIRHENRMPTIDPGFMIDSPLWGILKTANESGLGQEGTLAVQPYNWGSLFPLSVDEHRSAEALEKRKSWSAEQREVFEKVVSPFGRYSIWVCPPGKAAEAPKEDLRITY